MKTPLPLREGALFIDNSALEYYTTCKRSFEYHSLRKRELAAQRPALAFGQAIHSALERRYSLEAAGQVTSEDDLAFLNESCLDVLAMCYKEQPAALDDYRTFDYAVELLFRYTIEYPIGSEPFKIVQQGNKWLIETPFAVPVGSIHANGELIPVIWTGKIDLVTQWQDGSIWIVDHKTTSQLGPTFSQQFRNDQAQLGYCFAVRATTGLVPAGFMINALVARKGGVKTGPSFEFHRFKEIVDPSRLDEWLQNIRYLISDLIRDAERHYWPMETKWCVGKFGPCQYLSVCELPPGSRDVMLDSGLYQNVLWDPLHKENV